MSILVGALVVVAVVATTITAMLVVRRQAPEGSYFSDGERASGVFGVCYGRSVAGVEWNALATGNLNDSVNPWAAELLRTIQRSSLPRA